MKDIRVEALNELGLSELEASIYILLLGEPGLTGYAVAKKLGKAVPNVYRGISSLRGKGGLIGDATESTEIFTAIPIKEFTHRISSALKGKINHAEQVFKDSPAVVPEGGVFKIVDAGQIIAKAVALITSAEHALSIFADSDILHTLKTEFIAAAAKGVSVSVRSYDEVIEAEGCDIFMWPRRDEREPWGGQILSITADGAEAIVAYIPTKSTASGFWVKNPFLVTLLQQGMASGIIHGRLITGMLAQTSADKLLDEMQLLTAKHVYGIPHGALHRDLEQLE